MARIRFVRFLTVGGCATAVDFGSLATLRGRIPPTAAFSGAYLAGVTTHFLLNKYWTFRCVRADHWKQLGEYLVVIGLVYWVQLAGFRTGMVLFRRSVAHDIYLAKAIAVPPGTIVGYFLLKMRVFKDVHDPIQEDN